MATVAELSGLSQTVQGELSCRVSDPESGAHVAVDLGELFAQAPTEEESTQLLLGVFSE